jgi:hypothetical protein
MFYEGLDVLRKDLRELEEGMTSLRMYAFAISLTANCFAVNEIRAHLMTIIKRSEELYRKNSQNLYVCHY